MYVAVHLLISQAVWRGHMVRRQQSSRAVQMARQRVRQANASAQKALSIKHRLPSILECLKNCKYLTSLANQLHTLGTAPCKHVCKIISVYKYIIFYTCKHMLSLEISDLL